MTTIEEQIRVKLAQEWRENGTTPWWEWAAPKIARALEAALDGVEYDPYDDFCDTCFCREAFIKELGIKGPEPTEKTGR